MAAPPVSHGVLPVTVVTGALGAGKTSLIARLMAQKPHGENWVVLLNEFTEAGIDALTVAAAARGRYDVRLVAGGCLCCTGEQDFRRNLRELLAAGGCDRLIVEPSGAGHPAGMVEELLAHQAQGALQIDAILGLIDPVRLAAGVALQPGLARDQLDIADALVLAKGDLATTDTAAQLQRLQQSLFPLRPLLDARQIDVQALLALQPLPALALRASAAQMAVPAGHVHGHGTPATAHDKDASHAVLLAGGLRRSQVELLGVGAATWTLPRGRMFSEQRLLSMLGAGQPLVNATQRIKGVFQVAEDRWLLVQRSASGCSSDASAWRRDSRVEVLSAIDADWPQWDALWQACLLQP